MYTFKLALSCLATVVNTGNDMNIVQLNAYIYNA